MNQVGSFDHVCSSANVDSVVYEALTAPVILSSNQKYLVCLTTYNPEVAFGYDRGVAYDLHYGYYLSPISPLLIDGTWYSGWNGASAFSLGLKMSENLGLAEANEVSGVAYPNPANDEVTVAVAGEGVAKLTVADITGKVAFTNTLNLVNGKSNVNISSLDAGVYVFNVVLENGKTSQFNVVKK